MPKNGLLLSNVTKRTLTEAGLRCTAGKRQPPVRLWPGRSATNRIDGARLTNPILIEVTRGPLIESVHCGAIAIADSEGHIVAAVGDIGHAVFPRSSIKALQCIPLVESGAADHFHFNAEDLALACGSHTGTEQHAKLAASMLERVGLPECALGCGAHPPLGAGAAKALWRSGGEPTQFHNNCSGKHVGMLATALHCGEPTAEYWLPEHPVQKRVHDILCELTGLELGPDVLGIDGCSVPNWAMPVETMARVFARLVTPGAVQGKRGAVVRRILEACWARPDLVAGKGRADTVVMAALPGRVFLKTGAEGVYAGGFPELGLGFALKIDDGTTRASAGMAVALVESIIPQARGLMSRKLIKSWRGAVAGEIRAAPALETFLAEVGR